MSLYNINDGTIGCQLASNYTASSGSLVLKTGQGANFPGKGRVTVVQNAVWHTGNDNGLPSNTALTSYTYTSVSTDTLLGVSAISGFTDRNYSAGDYCEQRFMAEHIDDLNAAVGGNQSANTVFAGPTTGSAAAPTFRAMVTADLPTAVGGNQSANTVFAGPTTGSAAAPAFRATVPADLPTTGLTITQHVASTGIATVSGGATTLDATAHDKWSVTLVNGTPTAITISGMVAGQTLAVSLLQDGTGSCTATYALSSGTLKWAGGTAPTLSTGANKGDKVVFDCVSSGVVWGMVAGQNF